MKIRLGASLGKLFGVGIYVPVTIDTKKILKGKKKGGKK